MFDRLGEAVVAHPWRIIVAWVAVAAFIIIPPPSLTRFTSNNNSSFLPGSYQSVQAENVAQENFPAVAGASGLIAVNRTDSGVLTTSDQQKISALAGSLSGAHIPAVTSVTTSASHLSGDGKVQLVQLVQVVFAGQPGDQGPNAAVPDVRDRTTDFLAGSGLQGGLTGNAAISVDSTNAFRNAEKIITVATVVLILLLLGFVFRSPIIAVLPIAIIGIVHQMAEAVTADLADWLGFVVGPELAPLLLVVMFGVGTDYIVFLLFRHREHVSKGDGALASLESLRALAPGCGPRSQRTIRTRSPPSTTWRVRSGPRRTGRSPARRCWWAGRRHSWSMSVPRCVMI